MTANVLQELLYNRQSETGHPCINRLTNALMRREFKKKRPLLGHAAYCDDHVNPDSDPSPPLRGRCGELISLSY